MYSYLVLFQTVPPIFAQSSPGFIEHISSIENTRLIMLSNWNTSTEFCSELQSKDIVILCRAVSIPVPQVDILVNGNFIEPLIVRTQNEVVVISGPISYGEVVMFECRASTERFTSNVVVNLTYTCKCIMIIYCTGSEFVAIFIMYVDMWLIYIMCHYALLINNFLDSKAPFRLQPTLT